MQRELNRLEQLAFAQLLDLSLDRGAPEFGFNGSFVKGRSEGHDYWYYQGYERRPGEAPTRPRTFVGKVGDPDVEAKRLAQETCHARYRERRRISSSLRQAGLAPPVAFDGAVVDALARAGAFEAGAMLVGSIAFQAYPGLVGRRLTGNLLQTGDVDTAQSRQVLVHLPASTVAPEALGDALRRVDPTFEPILDRTHPSIHLGYVNKVSYKVEFLTSGSRRAEASTSTVPLRGMDGVSAQPVQFLEYLLEAPVRSIVLHDDGVPVLVPAPARYAVHKLIVAHVRERYAAARGTLAPTVAKIGKDASQADEIFRVLAAGHRGGDVVEAWEDAWGRGAKWRTHLTRGIARLRPDDKDFLEDLVLSTAGPSSWPDSVAGRGSTGPGTR